MFSAAFHGATNDQGVEVVGWQLVEMVYRYFSMGVSKGVEIVV
jgi:hypothetical protein